MTRELDRRDFSVNKVTAAQEAQLQARAADASARLPGAQQVRIASFDATTGNPRMIISEAAPAETGNYVQRALDYVRNISGVLGLAPTQPAEFVADPHLQQTSSNAVTVHLQQQYKGIPIFQAAQAVHFAPDGTLQDTTGSSVTVAQEVPISPKLSVQEAVLRAAEYVAVPQPDEQGTTDQFGEPLNLTSVDLTGFVPKVIATFPNKPDSPTVLEAGPFGDEIKASLIWFPLGNELRLAWEVIVTMPAYEGQYRTMVDANSGEILYCHQLVQTVAAQGNVYLVDGGSPRQMTNFPLPLGNYGRPIPGGLPAVFPDTWVAVDSAVGNCTNGHQGDTGPTFQGAVVNGLLTFDPANAVGVDQEVLNIFYYCCYMHDYFYLLGFREADGNFQQDDFGRGGVGSDRVDARAYPGAVAGTASMSTPVDGSSPVMRMGLVTSTNRHTALDSSVIFHEFMHGVTNRLVGGPLNVHALDAIQSGGMGEGWGDYDACTINNSTVVGAWVVNNAGGIRGFPYDSNFPDNFGNLGTGRYTEVHNIGEIWCATLMEMTRNIGKTLGVQLVVDALKLSPANPSFLDMRDAILRALDNMLAAGQMNSRDHFMALYRIWVAFAKFGMGPGARSNGAQLSGIVADFSLPPILKTMWHTIRHADGSWQPFFGDVGGQTLPPGVFTSVDCAGIDGELHVCGTTRDGGLGHTIRHADGSWQPFFGDVKSQTSDPGPFVGARCASINGELHICGVTTNGGMWHTIRHADGSWQPFFGDVKSQTSDPGLFRAVGCAGVNGELHVCGVTEGGGMWHTIRHADGSWQPFFGDVKSQTSDPGPFSAVGCAGVNGELQVCGVITLNGGMWHTIRHADGSWQPFFGDVKSQTSDPGPFSAVGCAGVNGELQVCGVIVTNGGIWHTIRHADGSWQPFFGDVKSQTSDPGRLIRVGCAGIDGELHVSAVTLA